jgi:hypothetical protein
MKFGRMGATIVFMIAAFMFMAAISPGAEGGKPTPPPADGYFTTTTVDSKGWVGDYNRISIDSSGNAHITWLDWSLNALKYGTNAPGYWAIEKIAVVGSRTNIPRGGVADIAVDANDVVHIIYIDINHSLVYAKKSAGSWTTQPLFPGRIAQGQVSLALDGNGGLHFTYYDRTGSDTPSIRYASLNDGVWSSLTIYQSADVDWYTSLVMGPGAAANVVLINKATSQLIYTTDADGWMCHNVDPTAFAGLSPGIALDDAGVIHIAYTVWTADPNQPGAAYLNVKYAHGSADVWECHMVDASQGYGQQWTPISVDDAGVVHIVYNHYSDNVGTSSLRYVTFTGEVMSSVRTVEGSQGSGYYLDMETNSSLQTKVHISFVNDARWDLKYAVTK